MNKTILNLAALIFLSFNTTSYSQNISPLDIEKQAVNVNSEKTNLTEQKKQLINDALKNQNYSLVYENLSSTIQNEDYHKFLLSKISEAHPPIYWLLADYYTSTNNPKEAHKWYYIAIITTEQDSSLCLDLTAKYATQKIMKNFPKVLSFTRSTPQFISPAMSEVSFFVENIKQRPDAKWVCVFGENEHLYPNVKLINQQLWKEKRDSILKKFTASYTK